MEDLAQSAELGRLVMTMLDDDKIVAGVCDGPAPLLSARRPDGTWAFAGRELAGFTNDEETEAGPRRQGRRHPGEKGAVDERQPMPGIAACLS
jgi:putative intracellular protease/amidase